MLEASCSNCASWVPAPPGATPAATPASSPLPLLAPAGACQRTLAPPQGELLCAQYEASPAFMERILSAMLKESPMTMPIALPGKAARDARQANRR